MAASCGSAGTGGCSLHGAVAELDASPALQWSSKRIWSCFCLPSAGLHLSEQSTLPQPSGGVSSLQHLLVVTLGEHKPGARQILAAPGSVMIW